MLELCKKYVLILIHLFIGLATRSASGHAIGPLSHACATSSGYESDARLLETSELTPRDEARSCSLSSSSTDSSVADALASSRQSAAAGIGLQAANGLVAYQRSPTNLAYARALNNPAATGPLLPNARLIGRIAESAEAPPAAVTRAPSVVLATAPVCFIGITCVFPFSLILY